MADSLEQLSKSQIFDHGGQVIDDTVKIFGTNVSQTGVLEGLENTIVDQKYKIISLLGAGGMGAVYKAHHLLLDKDVALKTFRSSNLSEENWQRFQREAKAISRLAHKNIVQVYDFGFGENNVPYYTMECLTGQSLADNLADNGALPLELAVKIFLQICDGLSFAHSKGIIHRDLKPANMFLASEPTTNREPAIAKIVDFGLAGLAVNALEQQKLTATGTIFGSPLYMSPEQSMGQEMTPRSDIYSLGCTLFETIAGAPPFRGDNAFATMLKHQQAELPNLADVAPDKEFPQRMQGLLAKMMAKNPAHRYQSLTDVSRELEQILEIAGSSQRRELARGQTKLSDARYSQSNAFADSGGAGYEPSSRQVVTKASMIVVLAAAILISGGVIYFLYLRSEALHSPPKISKSTETRKAETPPEIKRYLQDAAAPPGQDRFYLFPSDISLGELRTFNKYGQLLGDKPQASGKRIVPAALDLELHADETVALRPELLDGFAPGDLQSLVLPEGSPWQNDIVNELVKIQSLKSLDIEDTAITSDVIARLDELPKLKVLKVGKTAINQDALAKLKILPSLCNFSAESINPITKVLKALKGSTTITNLFIAGCGLKDSDMKLISTMSNLTDLEISDNLQISDDGLRAIRNLKKLRWLGVYSTNLTPACANTLQNFPALRELKIDAQLSAAADLQKILPLCKLGVGKHTHNDREAASIDLVGTQSYRIKANAPNATKTSEFLFPTDKSLGTLIWGEMVNGKSSDEKREAQGRVLCPSGKLLTFQANKLMADNPTLFYGFGQDDIFSLQLLRDCGWGDRQMRYVSRLSGLNTLNLSESEVSDKSISELNKFTKITALGCEKTHLSGHGLASLYRLGQIRALDISHMPTFADCLPKLEHSASLEDLRINACNIKNSDLEHLVAVPNLNSLNIAENPQVTNHGLIILSRIKELEALNISRTGIDARGIEKLKALPKLKRLTMTFEGWSKSDQMHLHKVLKNVKIEKARDDLLVRAKTLKNDVIRLIMP